jgi:hypothetical protein
MTAARQKPGVAFWATVVVVLALVYPVSFGPACWISSHTGTAASMIPTAYKPIVATFGDAHANEPGAIGEWLMWYSMVGARNGWTWMPWIIENDARSAGWDWIDGNDF